MKIHPLYSSSSGNATRIISSTEKTDVLLDSGVSWKKVTERTSKDYTPHAIIVTHEHSDHISGVGVAGRKTGSPIYILEKCYNQIINSSKGEKFFKNCDIRFYKAGDVLTINDELEFHSFSVRHDSSDIVNFKIVDKTSNKSLGFLTDTGVITPLIVHSLKECDAYCIEMDYDTVKLAEVEIYDPALKRRIDSPWGHLSNQSAIEYIENHLDLNKISYIIPLHLSERTNTPELVLEQLIEALGDSYSDKFIVAPTETFINI